MSYDKPQQTTPSLMATFENAPSPLKYPLPNPMSLPSLPSPTKPRLTSKPQSQPESELINSSKWNTQNLSLRVGVDLVSAATASLLVAPLICVIDRSIVEKAAHNLAFWDCLKRSVKPALFQPHKFLVSKPFLLIFAVYFGTYTTANGTDTLTSTIQNKPANHVSAGPAKFAATSSVNMTLCVYKDTKFAKWFGPGSSLAASKTPVGAAATAAAAAATATVPLVTRGLFAARDSLTMFASFNLPPLIAPKLARYSTFSKAFATESSRLNTAQFLAPTTIQLFSTPIHLLGLDLYNRPSNLGVQARLARIWRDWGVSTFARMGRILPAFGVGGVVNASARRELMKNLS